MTLSATSRVCPICATLLPEAPPFVCAKCATLGVPLVEDWPPHLVTWLHMMRLRQMEAPWARFTVQQKYERLLHAVIAGETWHGQVVPLAASALDCYAIAVAGYERWVASGMPALV